MTRWRQRLLTLSRTLPIVTRSRALFAGAVDPCTAIAIIGLARTSEEFFCFIIRALSGRLRVRATSGLAMCKECEMSHGFDHLVSCLENRFDFQSSRTVATDVVKIAVAVAVLVTMKAVVVAKSGFLPDAADPIVVVPVIAIKLTINR